MENNIDKNLPVLAGSGGGKSGGNQRAPVEAPDSLRSIELAKVLDIVSEGEIVGFADAANPLSCVFFNYTPLANADGSLNFKNVQIESRVGTMTQDYIPGFEAVENEIGINVELRSDAPWVRAISNPELTAARVTLSVQALSKANTSNGDVTGYYIGFKIELKVGSGSYTDVIYSAFSGKSTSPYSRSYRIELPPSATGWTIRITRFTPNANSATIQDITRIDSYTEIADVKLRYPMTALVGVVIDAEQFSSIPTRTYRLKGRIIKVPTNYNPVTRVYTGIWDGTFQLRYSNNPAWVFYDLVMNDRYGLGHMITADQVDRYALYKIGRYCDEMVPDGKGGTEPRFTCNIFFQQQNDALRVLLDLASVFRGILYAANGAIAANADMPEDDHALYTPSNVIDGLFTYSGTSRKVRHTVALVSWNDMEDFGRPKIEYVDDPSGIARYGIQPTDVLAVGCTSRGQARRLGKYMLATERYETDSVVFSVGLDGLVPAPGKIIAISDPLRAGKRTGGRVRSATINTVTLDRLPEMNPGDTIYITKPDATVESREVLSIAGETVTVTANFSAIPIPHSVWAVETVMVGGGELHLQRYRVISVEENRDNNAIAYTIAAIQHVEGKFDYVDLDTDFEEPPISDIPPKVIFPPTGIAFSQRDVADHHTSNRTVTVSWNPSLFAVKYLVRWRHNNGSWQDLGETASCLLDISNVPIGAMEVQIIAVSSVGLQSEPAYEGPYYVDQSETPPQIINGINSFGDELLSNGSFEQMTMNGGAPATTDGAWMADGWCITEVFGTNNPIAQIESAGAPFARTGPNSLLLMNQTDKPVSPGFTYTVVTTWQKVNVTPSEKFVLLFGAREDFANPIPAGIQAWMFVGMRFFDAAGNFVDNRPEYYVSTSSARSPMGLDSMNAASNRKSWVITVPAGAVTGRPAVWLLFNNTTGAPINLPFAVLHFRVDDVSIKRVSVTGSSPNMLVNTEFSRRIAGWGNPGSIVTADDTRRMQYTPANDTVYHFPYQDITYGVTAGAQYSASVEIAAGGISGNAYAQMEIGFFNAGYTNFTAVQSEIVNLTNLPVSGRKRLEVIGAVAPPNTAIVRFLIVFRGPGTWQFLKPKLERSLIPTAYMPGADSEWGNELVDRGSRRLLGGPRNVPVSQTMGFGAVRTTAALTANSSGQISVNAHSVDLNGEVVSYSAVSNAITGVPVGQTRVIYCFDPYADGGVQTWYAANTVLAAQQAGEGVVIAGQIAIPSTGTGTGGQGGDGNPGDWCVDIDTVLPDGRLMRHLQVGDQVQCVDVLTNRTYMAPLLSMDEGEELCYRITTQSGCSIIQSRTTPMDMADGTICHTPNLKHRDVLTMIENEGSGFWEEIVSVEPVGIRRVLKPNFGNRMFFAGEHRDFCIATHNANQKP